MVDNSNMPHPKCLGSQKNLGTEPKTCEKGPKLGFEYLPTSKTSHCVRTACALRAHCVHGIPLATERPCVTGDQSQLTNVPLHCNTVHVLCSLNFFLLRLTCAS